MASLSEGIGKKPLLVFGFLFVYLLMLLLTSDWPVFENYEILKIYRKTTYEVATRIFERAGTDNFHIPDVEPEETETSIENFDVDPFGEFIAPRSSLCEYGDIELDNPERKWFVYSPSGGFNNQRMELEYALHIGKLLNRSILAPMAAPHTNVWFRYQRLTQPDLFPMDRILDFKQLETYGTRICPLNETLMSLIQKLEKMDDNVLHTEYHEHRERGWHAEEVRKYLGPISAKVLFLKGSTMFHPWFPSSTITNVRSRSRYIEQIRWVAMRLANSPVLGGKFNAVHVRLGDRDRYGQHPDLNQYAANMLKRNFSRELPLYVATEPEEVEKRPEFFEPLYSKWKVVYAKDLPQDLVEEFRNVFPERSRNDMFGIIEQLLCAHAYTFRGTSYSRFSQYIVFIRHNRESLFPETVGQEFNVGPLRDGTPKTLRIKY